MSGLHRRRHAVQHDDLVAPIELVGLARRKGQRNVGRRRRARMFLPPTDRVTADGGVAAVKAKPLQFLENANQGQTLARRFLRIGLQQSLEPLSPRPKSRHRLPGSLVTKLRRPRPDDFPNHFARVRSSRQISLIALPCEKYARRILAIVSTTSIPIEAPNRVGGQSGPVATGSRLDAHQPRSGVRPWEWTDWAVGIAPSAGLPEDGSHDEAPITQRRVQAAGR